MRVKEYLPTGRNISRHLRFDSIAAPFFHAGSKTGCLTLHGFCGTPANVRPLADALASAGYTVYAPLLSGHGTALRDMDAQNENIWIQDARNAYRRLQEEGCTQIVVMGLSMGGLLASVVAQTEPCAGLVLMSAPFIMREYLRTAMRMSAVFPYILAPGETRYQRNSYRQGYTGTPLRKLHDLERLTVRARGGLYKITCPTLILQSALDNRVDMESIPIVQNGVSTPDVSTIMLEHSKHCCTFGPEKELVAEYCLDFVQRVTHA